MCVRVCEEHHPIEYAIDGTNRWWQSPSIMNGMEYHYVTITLDLKQVENLFIFNTFFFFSLIYFVSDAFKAHESLHTITFYL